MTIDQLRGHLQPHLEQDFDALYEDFIDERSADSPGDTPALAQRAFVEHLLGFQLISADVAANVPFEASTASAADEGAPPPDEGAPQADEGQTLDWDDATDEQPKTPVVFAKDVKLDAIREQVFDQAGVAAPPPAPSPPSRSPESAPALFDEDESPDETKSRRTMFRRMTGGDWRETGEQARPEAPKRERRRRKRRSDEPQVDARYQILGTVGEGAMGRIHVAADGVLNRKVAYKQMSEEIAEQATLASKFTAEAQITAQLDHPNIVPIYNLENAAAYTMKLIRGKTLDDVVKDTRAQYTKNRGRLDEDHTLTARLELFLKVCDALGYAHARGIIHRDLKPENIMVGEWGEVYVMDWGIARPMATLPPNVTEPVVVADQADEGDLIIGTPGYMSPEQADGKNAELQGPSDQYSLGLILFELVTLKPAVTGKAPLKIVMRHQDGEKDPMVHFTNEKVPIELIAIVHKATAKLPERRYADVDHFADDVKRYLRGEAVRARPDGPWQSLLRWMGRHREFTVLSFTAVFLMSVFMTLVVFGFSQWRLTQAERREQLVSTLLTTVARQGSLIDGQFLKYEGLVSVVAATATDALTRTGVDERPFYYHTDFKDPATAPKDVDIAKRYGMAISITDPAFVLPKNVNRSAVEFDVKRLTAVNPHLHRVLLRSHSEETGTFTAARARRAIADVGVPAAWAYVGLENGVYQVYPGHGNYNNFDPRERPWYQLAVSRRGPIWGAPGPDDDSETMGLVLTCAQALYDEKDKLLGVAGIDVTFDYLIEALLEAPEFQGGNSETYLLDPDGRIVVRSSSKGKRISGALTSRAMRLQEFGVPEVVARIRDKRSGYVETRDQLIVFNRMNSIGWYYVVAGPEADLLARLN